MMPSRDIRSLRILVVDDNAANISVAVQMLEEGGYPAVASTVDAEQAVAWCEDECPDLLVLDLHMPLLDGFEVLRRLERLVSGPAALPVLVVTADATVETRLRALTLGARDFVTKPLDQTDFLLRTKNLLQTRRLQLLLEAQNEALAVQVADRTASLEDSRRETLERLALVSEYRDSGTHEHAGRIGRIAESLARELGVPDGEATLLGRAAPLHDIGKIGVPDSILRKPGPLDDEEWAVMRAHTLIGAEILSGGSCPIIKAAQEIALCHHERVDGTGYPRGLAGDAIPLAARIVTVADAFDALTSDRPYRRACSPAEAIAEIQHSQGQFDTDAVGALRRVVLGGQPPARRADQSDLFQPSSPCAHGTALPRSKTRSFSPPAQTPIVSLSR